MRFFMHFLTKVACLCLLSPALFAETLTLSSQDIEQGKMMAKKQEFVGFGCKGENLSPQLSWKNAPKGTKSFAVTAYDPDAPTGSGWWHWQIINIPNTVTTLAENAGSTDNKNIPKGSLQIENDYGSQGFGGACPPVGHGQHRYQFTVYALSVEKLELKPTSSAALVGYMINANKLASSTIEALYERK